MTWIVECLEEFELSFLGEELPLDFQKKVTDHILENLENIDCIEMNAKHIAAPVRCTMWRFNMPDADGTYWRFNVVFNQTEIPGTRRIYDVQITQLL